MSLIKIFITGFVVTHIISQTNSLVELPAVEDNDILTTESAIRNTVNQLFLKLKLIINNKIKEYVLVHNYLVSLTLEDYDNLKEIAKLTKLDRRNINNTEYFIAIINEILDDDDKSNSFEEHNEIITKDDNTVQPIEDFIHNIEYIKKYFKINETYSNLNINDEILKHLSEIDKNNKTYTNDLKSTEHTNILSDNEFWRPDLATRRIYRGERTKIKYFPFMASIQIFKKFQCGGSIIKSDLIISAASCLQLAWNNRFFRENPAFLSVQVGSNFYTGGGEAIPVLEVYFHPEYNPKNLRNNICLLRLTRKIRFRRRGKKVKKIDIDRNPSSLPSTTDGITIVGWGAKGSSNIILDPWENQITFSVLDFYPLRECRDIYSSEYVTKKNFCAGFFSKGGGACNRDVGGPGVVNGVLTGVISFGSPVCGTPDAPTVFTKLGYYADWIDEIMDQDVPYAKKRTTLKPPFSLYQQVADHTYRTKPTFKIAPIGGAKMQPVPIRQVDPLRILEDETLFDEFLKTMFDKKEAEQYQDLLTESKKQDVITEKPKATMKIISKIPTKEIEIIQPATKMNFDEREPITESYKKYTALDENAERQLDKDLANLMSNIDPEDPADLKEDSESDQATKPHDSKQVKTKHNLVSNEKHPILDNNIDAGKHVEKELIKLMSDINLEENVSEHYSVSKQVSHKPGLKEFVTAKKEKAPLKPTLNKKQVATMENNLEKIDDSILTLLYLSDSEKNKSDNDDVEDPGLSIATDPFKDFTYRNNGTDIFDILPKSELYDLLSEAIDDTKNKDFLN